jgi:hypothetical protein
VYDLLDRRVLFEIAVCEDGTKTLFVDEDITADQMKIVRAAVVEMADIIKRNTTEDDNDDDVPEEIGDRTS